MFEDGERIFMETPEDFEKHFAKYDVTGLRKTIYGLKQSDRAFYCESVRGAKFLKCKRNGIDPSVFFKRT